MPETHSGRNIVEVLAEEFVDRYRRGDRPPLTEYTQKYPQHAAEIEDLFPALLMMENLKPVEEDADAAQASQLSAAALDHLGDYRIIREVGRGGMGIVYEAEQVSLGRHVALKVLPKELLQNSKQRLRFEREARAAAKLHHTNIVPVFGVGEDDGMGYYVMQFIQGLALDEVLEELKRIKSKPGSSSAALQTGELRVSRREMSAADVAHSLVTGTFENAAELPVAASQEPTRNDATYVDDSTRPTSSHTATPAGRLSDTFMLSGSSITLPGPARSKSDRKSGRQTYWHSVARIGVQVAEALAYAHGQGVLHRDIKPGNLLLDVRGTVWITDFGLAKLQDDHGLTQTGDILGTLRYMAPETFKGFSDARSEIYSVGLTLYELLALRPAFDQTNRNVLVDQVMTARIESLSKLNPDVPADLRTIVHKTIERDPAHRYQTAQELADDLERFIEDEPIKARRVSSVERFARWSRHNRGLATALAVVAVLLLIINVSGPIYAWRMAQLNKALEASKADLSNTVGELTATTGELSVARRGAERTAADNLRLAQDAEIARQEAQTMLADMQTQRGLLAAEQGDPASAMLWFASAAEQTPHDPRRQAENRLRARNWMHRTPLPVASFHFPVPGNHRRVAFQPGGDLLLVANFGSLQIWDWRFEQTFPWADALTDVSDACWSPDGLRVAVGFGTGDVRIYAVSSGEVAVRLTNPARVQALAYAPDGSRLAIGSHVVRVWSVSGEPVLEHEWPHPAGVHSVTFNRAGTRLATACEDKQARVFAVVNDSDLPAPLFAPVPHDTDVGQFAPIFLDRDQRLITVYSGGHRLGWWNAETGEDAAPPAANLAVAGARMLAASADGAWFAVATGDSCDVCAANGESLSLKHPNHVTDVAITRAGAAFVTGCYDWRARLWSAADEDPQPLTVPHLEAVQFCAISDDGRHFALCGHEDVRVWMSPEERSIAGYCAGWNFRFWRPRIGFDGRWATPGQWHEVSASSSQTLNTLTVVDVNTGQPAGPPIALSGIVDSCLCSDNTSVAIARASDQGGQVDVVDVLTGRRLTSTDPLPCVPHSIAARPGQPELAVLGDNGHVVVVDQRTGQPLRIHTEGNSTSGLHFPRVTYSPDGQALVTLISNNLVFVRDADTGKLRFPPIRPVLKDGPCRSMAISGDSRWLATGVNGQNAVQVWDLSTGEAASRPLPHPGDFYGIFSVAFSPDGRWVISGNKDGRARVWDWEAGTLVCPPLQHADEVLDAAFTADGRHVLTAVRNGPARLWEVATGKLVAAPFDYPIPDGTSTDTLAIAGNRAIVGAIGYPVLDLSQLLEEPELSTEALKSTAELAAGGELLLGERSVFSLEEWRRHWASRTVEPFASSELVDRLAREIDRNDDSGVRMAIARRVADQRLLEPLIAVRPDVPQLQMVFARALKEQGDDATAECREHALELCRRRLAKHPDDNTLRVQLAQFLVDEDQGTWMSMTPSQMKSESGAAFQLLADDSLLTDFRSQAVDSYTITARCDVTRLTAIRLEALPHPSLPHWGPGWAAGNFHLTEFQAWVVRPDGEALRLTIRAATSDYSRRPGDQGSTERDGPHGAIDGDQRTRWDVSPQFGRPHWLVLHLDEPVEIAPEDQLRVQLDFRDPVWKGHLLGRLRLSACDEQGSLTRQLLQAEVNGNALGGVDALGAAYLVIGEPQQALELLNSFVGADGETSERLLLLAQAQLDLGQQAAAHTTCDQLLERVKSEPLPSALEPVAIDLLRSERQWDVARIREHLTASAVDLELNRLTRDVERNPNSLEGRRARGNYLARLGRWKTAADDYLEAVKLQPDNRYPWLWAAPCLILAGEDELYQEHCRRAVEQFRGSTEAGAVDVVCKICLLRPGTVDLTELPIAELRHAIDDPAVNNLRPWFVGCAALIAYREGNHQQVLDWTADLNSPGSQPIALAMLVRAMAEHRLGNTEQARQTLAQVEAAIPLDLRTLGTESFAGELPVPAETVSHDWLVPEILRREAAALISGIDVPAPYRDRQPQPNSSPPESNRP